MKRLTPIKAIMEEILPSIRKTGGYIEGQENMSDSGITLKRCLRHNESLPHHILLFLQ